MCRLGHGQRRSPAHSALPVAVTVKNYSFWQHCGGDLYLATLWLKAEVLSSTSASPSCTAGAMWQHHHTTCQFGEPGQHSQSPPKWGCDTLRCQTNWFAVNLYLDCWGCSNLIWASQEEKGQWDAFLWIKFQGESLGQDILTCVASSPHTFIVRSQPHARSEAPVLPSIYCKIAISGWLGFLVRMSLV